MDDKTTAGETAKTAVIKADDFGFSATETALLAATAFKELQTPQQRGVAMRICNKYGLDPFTNEFYAYLHKGRVLTTIGYMGWLTLIKRTDGVDVGSIMVNAIYPDDEFQCDLAQNKILKHITDPMKAGKDPVAAYCYAEIFGKPHLRIVRWEEYSRKGEDAFNPWNKQKSEMICAKAAAVFGRVYCGIHGLYAPGEAFESEEEKEANKKPKDTRSHIEKFNAKAKEKKEETEPAPQDISDGEIIAEEKQPLSNILDHE